MKTARRMVFALAAACAWQGWCAWEDWLQKPGLYDVDFSNAGYSAGEALSDKGATNGTWGASAVPDGASAVAAVDSRTYIDLSTGGDGILFTPDDEGCRNLKSVLFSVKYKGGYESFETLPRLSAEAKTSVTAYESGSSLAFAAWGRRDASAPVGWLKLHLASASAPIDSKGWCDFSVRFLRSDDGLVRVQYRVKTAAGYETLLTESNAAWLYAAHVGGEGVVRAIAFSGDGGLAHLTGTEPQRGLFAAVASGREVLFDESPMRRDTGVWSDRPAADGDCYVIASNSQDVRFKPAKLRSEAERVQVTLRFEGPNRDDAAPSQLSACVRVVEEPVVDRTQSEPIYRFACYADDAWHTNATLCAALDTDYVVEIAFDQSAGDLRYRIREGVGSEGNPFQTLFDGHLPPGAASAYADVVFKGFGCVRAIKGVDMTPRQ